MLEVLKEGLHTYLLEKMIQNTYFISVEYHVLRYNHPETLLPVQLRERDGERVLLYDVTGKKSIESLAEGKGLSHQDCRCFLEKLIHLMRELDNLMLELEHVNFKPDSIYKKEEKSFQWMYMPDQKYDPTTEIESLFSWMLGKIDYGDSKTVRCMYHVYWCVRNKTFSKELLQECLDYDEKNMFEQNIAKYEGSNFEQKNINFGREKLEEKNDGYEEENFKKMDDEKEDFEQRYSNYEKEGFIENNIDYGKKEIKREDTEYQSLNVKRFNNDKQEKSTKIFIWELEETKAELFFLALELIFILLLCGDFAMFVLFLIAGIQQNFPLLCIKYLIGSGILLVLFIDGIYQTHRKRKTLTVQKLERKREEEKEHLQHEKLNSEKNRSKIVAHNYTWEEEEGTAILGARTDFLQPALKSKDTGKIHLIQDFPFYIGSESGMNQLILKEKTVSRQHAVILKGKQTGSYVLQDLQSTNGTWIGEKALVYPQPVRLEDGDILRFAEKRYQFCILEDPVF